MALELDLPPRATITLTKSQVIRDFTTRRHYPGRHRVDLQVLEAVDTARTDQQREQLLTIAREQGYDTSKLIWRQAN